MRPSVHILTIAVLAALVPLFGCGGGSSPDPFVLCGNGRLDPGEQCDDGNTLDNDACLSTCVVARCGDGFVNAAVEQCDANNLGGGTCGKLGFSDGTLRCDADCRFDPSGCGAAFTPTATPTVTPTPTVTATPTATALISATPTTTPTATPLRCGNGLLESGELCTMCVPDDQSCCHTCDVCPADCEVKSCSAAAPTHTVAVSFAAPTSQDVTGLTIVLGYRSDVVSLPGTGADSSASARVKNRPSNTIFSAFDLDYALRAVLSRSNAFKPGQIFTVDFDGCSGSAAPTVADFGCSVVGCANSFGDVDGCSCSVSLE